MAANSVELAEAAKIIFREHGNDLPSVIAGTFLELCERCASLEARLAKLEASE
jgi:hypothetical protein